MQFWNQMSKFWCFGSGLAVSRPHPLSIAWPRMSAGPVHQPHASAFGSPVSPCSLPPSLPISFSLSLSRAWRRAPITTGPNRPCHSFRRHYARRQLTSGRQLHTKTTRSPPSLFSSLPLSSLWTLGMTLGEIYPKFRPRTCNNKLLKFQHCRPKKWNNCQNKLNLNILLGELILYNYTSW
jgi:hypothetical protein